jgi:YesN/AraC family two-component response regulator
MYKVLIVDDEFLARKLLQGYVEKIPDLELVGSCPNAFEAFKIIKQQPIDILLLDIHMPDLNGLDFARTCKEVPAIIFTTAYS